MQEDLHAESADPALPRRQSRLNRVSAVAFFLGGSLFALGAYFAQTGTQSLETVNVTYLIGGVFFSLGGWVLVRLIDLTIVSSPMPGPDPVHRWTARAQQSGWLGAVVLFGGTLLFGVSLVAAFAEGLTPRQSNGWIWLPDILGCVCFLISGRLALRDLRREPWRVRVDNLDWWVAAINQIGSVLFFLAGLA